MVPNGAVEPNGVAIPNGDGTKGVAAGLSLGWPKLGEDNETGPLLKSRAVEASTDPRDNSCADMEDKSSA